VHRLFMNIAHRGFSARYPENTIAAFRAALELGCTWLETDVRRTPDGVLVLLHDATVNRTTNGTGAVAELSWEEVSRLDAGSWKGKQFRGEGIPTLRDLLAFVSQRAQVVVELKLPVAHVREVVELVGDVDAFDWTVASAFEWEVVLRVRETAPRWRTTWLTAFKDTTPDEAISRCVAAGVDTLAPLAAHTDRSLVQKAHGAGLLVRCWGLGDDRGPEMRRLVNLGVDGMTTNHPDALMALTRVTGASCAAGAAGSTCLPDMGQGSP